MRIGPSIIFASVILSACSQEPTAVNNHNRVHGALRDLLTRTGDAFVIIEEKQSGKFIQFAGSAEEPLLLDLPAQTLSQAERERANALFLSIGGTGLQEWQVTDVIGTRTGTQAGFQMELGRDPESATAIALRVMTEVYGFPENVQLVITEN